MYGLAKTTYPIQTPYGRIPAWAVKASEPVAIVGPFVTVGAVLLRRRTIAWVSAVATLGALGIQLAKSIAS